MKRSLPTAKGSKLPTTPFTIDRGTIGSSVRHSFLSESSNKTNTSKYRKCKRDRLYIVKFT